MLGQRLGCEVSVCHALIVPQAKVTRIIRVRILSVFYAASAR